MWHGIHVQCDQHDVSRGCEGAGRICTQSKIWHQRRLTVIGSNSCKRWMERTT